MKRHYYSQYAGTLRSELRGTISSAALRELHRKSVSRHLVIAARQLLICARATWGLIAVATPIVWIPLAVVQGCTVFNFTILLQEVVHHSRS